MMSNNKQVEIPLEVEIHLEDMANLQRIFSEISHSSSTWEVWAVLVEREYRKDKICS